MELYTPLNIKADYRNEDGPRDLTAPFNLQSLYDASAGGDGQAITASGFSTEQFGTPSTIYPQFLNVSGFALQAFGQSKIQNKTTFVRGSGLLATAFGQATIINKNKNIKATGFIGQVIGVPRIYNLKQFVNAYSFNAQAFGIAYVQGGVKFVTTWGQNNYAVGVANVVNTRANRNLNISGIAAPSVPAPSVSPRIIYAPGILAWKFGTPQVQRNPSPKGFTTDLYGTAWISHSPRYVAPGKIESFLSGYAKIFDPLQRIYHEGSPPIPAGIFGDIAIRNTQRIIAVSGSDFARYGDWSEVHSNLITVGVQSFDANIFGNNQIHNKTPSIIPQSWDSAAFGAAFISDRVRRILGRGFATADVQRFGNTRFTKPPELNVPGSNQLAFGNTWISNKTRNIETGNLHTLAIGSHRIWFRYRYIAVSGIAKPDQGNPKIEHSLRTILGKGSSSDAYGQPTVWYRVRKISPASIYKEFESNHRVGGTQHIQPGGFVASQFGERIVPENQGIYALGFNAAEFSELNRIEHHTRWVRATGFHSFGQQTSDRYGTARIWNLRQYVRHEYDSGDGLNPGEFGQWTAISNRNRNIGVLGYTATRYGYNVIENKATPLLVQGFNGSVFSKPMIADRIRYLKPESMEAPYISGWGRIVNTAHVIKPVSGVHTTWGHPTVLNTRREYRWVGAFDSLQIGHPMIDFAIRHLSIESRYSIGPVPMALPKVDLHTRYIEPAWPELSQFGGPNLHIKWNIVTPRWTHRELFGVAEVRNKTPELKQRGVNTEIFGDAMLRLQWRPLPVEGYGTELWGRSQIAFRDRKLTGQGFNTLGFGQLRITKTGAPPYSLQVITLDWDGEGTRPDDFIGKGIEPPLNQVGSPELKTNVIFVSGFVATRFGNHHAQSNGILVQPGIQEFAIGDHTVRLRNQTITVPTMGDLLEMKDTRPRLSPHTIYAVMEAPAQAKANHPARNLHYVDSNGSGLPPGSVFGYPEVMLKHREVAVWGFSGWSVPRPSVALTKHYIKPTSISSFRMGWHRMLDGSMQSLEQFNSSDFARIGSAKIAHDDRGPRHLRFIGFLAGAYGQPIVDFYHRTLRPAGWNAAVMGSSRGGDTPYKPQSLWVGHPMPTKPAGFNAEIFGNTTIGLRVRELNPVGFDSFISELDISNFKGRMKVELIKKPVVIEPQQISIQSFNQTSYGVPDIRLKVHYIRPDGNSDQYRKGAPE